MKASSVILAGTLILPTATFSASFTNLHFERAVIQLNDPDFGWLDWSLAVPGWDHSPGPATEIVYYGRPHLGTTQIFMLLDTNTAPAGSFTPFEGNYSLMFASGYATSSAEPEHWTQAFISQSGDIPADTQSLRLLATGPFEVLLNNTLIPMVPLGGDSYGANIPDFAGTTAPLTILNTSPDWGDWSLDWSGQTATIVDNIQFSPSAIPEPSTLAMLVIAFGAMLGFRHHQSVSRKQEG